MKPVRIFGKLLAGICLLLMTLWGAAAIYYSNLPAGLRMPAAGAFALIALGLIVQGFRKRNRWGAFLLFFGVVLLLWFAIPPSNNRDWQPDLATLAWADITGDKVTIHNIRNCDYRTETDFTVRHYDRTFNLSKLKGIDFFLVYWG